MRKLFIFFIWLAMATLAVFAFPSSLHCKGKVVKGSLQIMYYWKLYPNCESDGVFSCRAPFHIRGRNIVGDHVFKGSELPLPPLLPHPEGDLQVINFSYTCGACKVKGTVIINQVKGRVERIKGRKILHFYVKRTRSFCKVDCPGTAQDFDCSVSNPVYDEFIMPMKDGYILDRGSNTLFKYALTLEK